MHQTQQKADVNNVFLEITAAVQSINIFFKENMSWALKSLFEVNFINMLIVNYSLSHNATEFRKENLSASV